MSDISIGVGVRDNASGVLPGISRAIEELAQSSEKLQKATDWNVIGNQVTALTKYREELERVSKLNDTMTRSGGATAGLGGGAGIGRAVSQISSTATGFVGGVGSDAAGAAIGGARGLWGMEGLKSMLSAAGPLGIAIGAVVTAGIGLATVTNELGKKYESFTPGLLANLALTGGGGGFPGGNSAAMRSNMRRLAEGASLFGYDLETGLDVSNALAKAGGRESSVGTVMSFTRGTGIGQDVAVRAEALRSRFGVAGIEGIYGAFGQTGMGAGRFGAYAQASLDLLENALSRGVVKGMKEITRTENLLAAGGELFRGTQGQAMYSLLESGIVGGTALQSSGDAIKYRAASSVAGSGAGYLGIMKTLERGLSPEMLNAVRDQIKAYTGGNLTDSIMMLRQVFPGLTFSQAEAVWNLPRGVTMKDIQGVAPSMESPELEGLRLQQKISANVASIGADVYQVRLGILAGVAALSGKASTFLTGNVAGGNGGRGSILDKSWAGPVEEVYARAFGTFRDIGSGTVEGNSSRHFLTLMDSMRPEQWSTLTAAGTPERVAAAYEKGGIIEALYVLADELRANTKATAQNTDDLSLAQDVEVSVSLEGIKNQYAPTVGGKR